jgi:hypothetical protein
MVLLTALTVVYVWLSERSETSEKGAAR